MTSLITGEGTRPPRPAGKAVGAPPHRGGRFAPKLPAFALLCAVVMLGASGCLDDETIRINVPPKAEAGEDQQLDYAGEPVAVRLDGRGSSDADGEVVQYIWRSAANTPDAGAEWISGALDPADRARPELELEQGTYTFMLWVVDNGGETSAPDSVTVSVGTDPIAECVAASLPAVPEACLTCVCSAGEACPEATVGCREDCWQLISCIGANCPDSTDTACIVDACSAFLGGATPAMAVGPCVTQCADMCRSGGAADGGA